MHFHPVYSMYSVISKDSMVISINICFAQSDCNTPHELFPAPTSMCSHVRVTGKCPGTFLPFAIVFTIADD